MSHYPVIVCLEDPADLEQALAPYDESLKVDSYRDYETGDPADFWMVESLRKNAALNPDDSTLTWAQVAEAYNAYMHDPDDPDGSDRMALDDDGRPYRMSTYNPRAKWDWYQVGGRWTGYFIAWRTARPEDLIIGSPGLGVSSPTDPWRCDGGLKIDLDFAAMRDEAERRTRTDLADWRTLVGGTPPGRPWSWFSSRVDVEPGYTIEHARADYNDQPRIRILRGTKFGLWLQCPIEHFQRSEQDLVAQARAAAVPGYAVLTLEGEWMAPGRMGWFGASSDTAGDRARYLAAANTYLEDLPDHIYLIAVDCHI